VRDQLTARLSELEQACEIGERRLLEIDAQRARLRETLLRVSGAIQVLHELLDANAPNCQASVTLASQTRAGSAMGSSTLTELRRAGTRWQRPLQVACVDGANQSNAMLSQAMLVQLSVCQV
jgi:hypothetical protein